MATLNPDHLFEQAEKLFEPPPAGPPRQVDVRRAVSAAYYAVFHALATAAADEFVGKVRRGTVDYGLAYRRVNHRWLRELCDDLRKAQPPKRLAPHLPSGGMGPEIQSLAAAVVELQEKRHSADYDPLIRVKTVDALLAVGIGRSAVARLGKASAQRRKRFLSLRMFPPR